MNQAPDPSHNSKPRWLDFNSRHKAVPALAAVALLAAGALLWRSAFKPHDAATQQDSLTPATQQDALLPVDPQTQIGLRWLKPIGSEMAYVGNNACQECHESEFKFYMASPHAHTVQEILPGQVRPEFKSKQIVADPLHRVLYRVGRKAGQNMLGAVSGPTPELVAARWALGSGTHAQTYLAQQGANFTQLRLTYYPTIKQWNFTPGSGPGDPFHTDLGDPYTSAQAAACFGCHSTVLIGSQQQLDLAHSMLNVGCESCHGPGRSHVESVTGTGAAANATSDTIIKPPTHTGAEIMQLCGACHRVPGSDSDAAPPTGVQISEPILARFPGIALPRSRCFIASADKLSCVTCHNPHESTHQQTLASFERKCMSCHTSPHGTPCARKMQSNCVSCHMPEEAIARRLPLRFHNHWIRKFPVEAAQIAAPQTVGRAFFSR